MLQFKFYEIKIELLKQGANHAILICKTQIYNAPNEVTMIEKSWLLVSFFIDYTFHNDKYATLKVGWRPIHRYTQKRRPVILS